MFSKVLVLCATVAVASAITNGYLDGQQALGFQSENTVRGFAGLSSISKQAKSVQSPFSSVTKSDVRVTNDASLYHPYAAPAYAHHGYAAPALAHGYAAPVAHHAYAAPVAHHAYAAPVAHHGYAAPALAHGYAAPALGHHAYAHPATYAAPLAKAPVAVHYSPASAVAHATFSGYGISYGY